MSRIVACLALPCAAIRRLWAKFNLVLINHHFALHNQKKESFHDSFLIIPIQREQCSSAEKSNSRKTSQAMHDSIEIMTISMRSAM